ncbi:MAG TPA: glycosyltransferase family 1 protein [Candidatus Agrococcus pullicola]|uniref:D-inositol 3-phosphate glycosyltransferase n=1 Tax=Candidatus Agrococcus pullicola TaxID=2838429 RepID=A0A9D2C7Y0_9MICO|nr:glycosyltransferase family 1 protein [Candidatus Agrococcus pullicola]
MSNAQELLAGSYELDRQNPIEPLRVLIVTESFLPQVNGVTNSVCRVASFLRARGHTVRIIAPTKPDVYEDAEVSRVSGVNLPAYRQFRVGLPSSRRLRRIADEFAPDVVHVASPFGFGAVALRALKHLPTLAVYQTDIAGYAKRYRLNLLADWCETRLERIHRSANVTLAPSHESRAAFADSGVDAHYWGRGVDLEQFRPAKRSEELHERLRGDRRLVVGYVGRLSLEKELEQLRAVSRIPDAQLVIVGDGPVRSRLEARLPEAIFTGVRGGDELAELHATFDVFVNPCSTETFCQAAQEALASGTPVVGPNAGGMRDRVKHRETGLLTRPGSASSLASAVEELVSDDALRLRLRSNARDVSDLRSWDELGEELEEHYRDLVASNAHRGRSAPAWI